MPHPLSPEGLEATAKVLVPKMSPLRNLGTPLPRYTPPPLAEDHARVRLGDDYYAGAIWDDWTGDDTDRPAEVFDIPAEQRDRWLKAQADYSAMQDEISALMDARAREPGFPNVPPGWQRKGSPYQPQP